MKWLALLLLCLQVFSSKADHHLPIDDASCNDPKVFEAVDLALKKYNADRKEGTQFALRRITEAGTTHEHGSEHYHVTYEIIESTCAAQDGHMWQDCQLKSLMEAAIGVCHAEVHINSAGKTGNVSSQDCIITPKMCGGCPIPIWSDDAALQTIVRHAIQKFNHEANDIHYYKLDSISKATRQVVAGTIYRLEYKIKETDCDKNKVSELHPGCKPLKLSGTCKATVYVALDQSITRIEQKCHMSVPEVRGCPGCPTPISSNSEELKPILKYIIGILNEGSNRLNLLKLEDVKSATSQVVAGKRYKIEFTFRETDCPKSKFKEVHPGCKPLEDSGSCKASVYVALNGSIASFEQGCVLAPPVMGCPGCKNPISSNSEELKPILKYIIGNLNEGSGRLNLFKVEEVKSATSQVVAGTRYEIEYTYRETDCPKSKFKEVHPGCKPLEDSGSCKATVYVALNGSIASFEQGCVLAPPVRRCVGCPTPISSNSEELKPILKFITEHLNGGSNRLNLFKIEEVTSATSQVVAGTRYEIEYTYRETDCPKSQFKEVHPGCKPLEDHGSCKASVHVAFNGSIASFQQGCVLAPPVPVCRGCHRPIPSDSERLKPVVEHCIQKFNHESGQLNLFKLGEVQKVTSQVVAGTNYKIEFTIKETNCSKKEFKELHMHCSPHKLSGTCKSSVFVALDHSIRVTQQNCALQVPPGPCLGCPKPLETNSTKLVEPLAHSVKKYNSESNDPVLYQVHHIEEATVQVVAGMKYTVTFTIKPTNCSKESNADLHAGCHFAVGDEFKRCVAEIVVVPWLRKVDPLKVSCSETLPQTVVFGIPGLSPFRDAPLVDQSDEHVTHHGQGHVPEAPAAMCPGEPWKPKSPSPPSQ